MNHWSVGWVDWNMALNLQGGPTYASNFCDSPILVNATAQEFYKQPMFYGLGHFSKFVPPDSHRIHSITSDANVLLIAFRRPDDGIALVVMNRYILHSIILSHCNDFFHFFRLNISRETEVLVEKRGKIPLKLAAHSITTILYW